MERLAGRSSLLTAAKNLAAETQVMVSGLILAAIASDCFEQRRLECPTV
jgi:hypothetical protein